jgi:hypothetical protein
MIRRRMFNQCQANMAHTKQSRTGYGFGFQTNPLETFQVVPSSLGSENSVLPSHLSRPDVPQGHAPVHPSKALRRISLGARLSGDMDRS